MHKVVQEIELLAGENTGVAILDGQDFILEKHWEDLEHYHHQQEEKQRQRTRQENRQSQEAGE